MKTNCLIFITLLSVLPVNAEHAYTEKQVVAYAKALDVATLDSTLAPQSLDAWFRSGAPRVDFVRWQMSPNCDEKAQEHVSLSGLPLCVKAFYQRGNVKGVAMIAIGTVGRGPTGPSHLEYVLVELRDQNHKGAKAEVSFSGMSSKLSDLPRLLDETSLTHDKTEVIAYAKALDVSTLDSALSSQRLDEWLHSGPPHTNMVIWGVSLECGLKAERKEPTQSEPALCVRFFYGRGNVRGWGIIKVGSLREGPSGAPHVEFVLVEPRYISDKAATRTSSKLSDLPILLDEVSAAFSKGDAHDR